jgi:hypothetical protein
MKYDQLQPRLRESSNKALETIGKYGCYLLCLFQIAKLILNDDDYELTLKILCVNYLKEGWIDGECSIINGPAILHDLTGERWQVEKVDRPILPELKDKSEIVYCYHAYSGDGYHFKTAYCDTEKEQVRLLAGYRIYTRLD